MDGAMVVALGENMIGVVALAGLIIIGLVYKVYLLERQIKAHQRVLQNDRQDIMALDRALVNVGRVVEILQHIHEPPRPIGEPFRA